MVMVGLLTLVTSRVGSVTSTSFLVNFGDMRTVSGPISRVSSGALPGHNSTTLALSAPGAGQATHNQTIRETASPIRFMVAPLCAANSAGTRHGLLNMLPVGSPTDDNSGSAPCPSFKTPEVNRARSHSPPVYPPGDDPPG